MMGNVINAKGKEIDFEAATDFMDDGIRERLNYGMAPCSEQEFFSAYEKEHEENFAESWELSKENPVW